MNWGEALTSAETTLKEAGIDSARQDARLLLAYHLNKDISSIMAFPEKELEGRKDFNSLISRRSKSEPVSHILGEREFWSLPFKVTSDVLDPRPDSETLIEAILGRKPNHDEAINIIDFGTGSGCLLLTLLNEYKQALGAAVDISEAALNIAQQNARNLDLHSRCQFIKSNWHEEISEEYDILVSNPPYITSADMKTLSKDVYDHEPHLALHGGEDGLNPYRILVPAGKQLLKKNGLICFEFGYEQADSVANLLDQNGYKDIQLHPDLSGIIRCATAFS
ncbi:peptide chain release factor N(5)-glutamine methyltransferase [Curvivirga aplysinae]|uniref:peptide chain release factor N(5)-glutamine methyltransferase n=1 Tax=Curvivirga aplysinae TaxID=2529852 RepID=UPI0012BB78E7|nr:peptide chain release factor N(5)-glutamine methyltransferase [Curvivirga aplysinae]MTI09164.1 peptide chain release factor N(5)-glutamine methyltransferase [Curvivirga aplysinae]